jgi:hypothetical protein
MESTFKPKVFQIGSKFGIRREAILPDAGQISGPNYSVVVPVDVFWTGESWSRTVWREFSSREKAEKYLAANIDRIMAAAVS